MEPRPGYASFSSTSPDVAATYAGESGGIYPVYVKADHLIEFPTRSGGHFNKFAFDAEAARLAPGEVLVARGVRDTGPRGSVEMDPEYLASYAADVYAWGPGTSVKSATGNIGTFNLTDSHISYSAAPLALALSDMAREDDE